VSASAEQWAGQIRAGEIRAISRAITAIENNDVAAEPLLRALFPHTGKAYRIGVTGAPGTGKSTLVDRLAAHYRSQQKPVGIIAVDPSSPFSGGAILGDRIRMQGHAGDSGIFIRSMATRGFLGGLARATADVALVLDAAGKEMVVVETVGVGQDEVDIMQLADCTIVVLVPGLGDEVQHIKAGLMEIGDVFVLNKADREGTDRIEQQVLAMLSLAPEHAGWRVPLLRTVATEGKGVAELAATVEEFRALSAGRQDASARQIARWKKRLLELLQARLLERVLEQHLSEPTLDALAADVAARKLDPYSAIHEVIKRAGLA
jgi:LAO/AO transport system kinase